MSKKNDSERQLTPGSRRSFVLAIDVGSSSTRAALYNDRAEVVANSRATRKSSIRSISDGTAEEPAMSIVERIEAVVDEVLDKAGDSARRIAAVGMDTFVSNVLGIDKNGEPITPVYAYADTRSKDDVDALRRELDINDVYQRTGCPQHTAYLPARLRWIKRTNPDTYRRVHRWVDIGTFLYTRWFGRKDMPVTYSVASWSGLLDRARMQWDEQLMRHLSLSPAHLPPLSEYTDSQSGLASPFNRLWPALSNVPFFLTVGDGLAANIGSGCITSEKVALTVGTSGAMRVLLTEEAPSILPGLWAYKFGKTRTLLGGSFTEGGNVFAWAIKTLNLTTGKELDLALRELPPDGHGLTALPFLAGERSPGWSTSARAVIDGMKLSTSPLEILQALLESVAYRFGSVGSLLSGYVNHDCKVIASGGAITNSPYWLQVMADVLQRPIIVSEEAEATNRGTAILALHASGIWPTLDAVPIKPGDIYRPDPNLASVYRAAMERQHSLYDSTIGHRTEIGQRLASRA